MIKQLLSLIDLVAHLLSCLSYVRMHAKIVTENVCQNDNMF